MATAAPALAQKSADTLRITWRDAIPDVDPYHNSQRTGMVVAFQAFDCLVYRDSVTMEIKPALATSWKSRHSSPGDQSIRLRRRLEMQTAALVLAGNKNDAGFQWFFSSGAMEIH
jgi:ABC-type transport system substrate-binding protein